MRSLFTTRRVVTKAVDGVSMTVRPGEMVGYLGPNGAGKSTTIKMLTGVLVPTSGRVEVNGLVPWRDRQANARAIGVVFGQRTQLWQDLPLRDSFELVAKLYGMGRSRYLSRLATFTDLLDLGPFIDTPVRSLSLGQRMRGDLAAAMLHEPPLLYLDEPTVGLDVVAKARIRDFISNLNADTGTTVILTTHDIADVERLCRRAVIIDEGRVAYDGDLDALRRRYLPYRELAVTVQPPLPEWDIPGVELVDTVAHHGHVILSVRHDPLTLGTPEAIGRITARFAVVDLTVKEPGLEQVIHRIYTAR